MIDPASFGLGALTGGLAAYLGRALVERRRPPEATEDARPENARGSDPKRLGELEHFLGTPRFEFHDTREVLTASGHSLSAEQLMKYRTRYEKIRDWIDMHYTEYPEPVAAALLTIRAAADTTAQPGENEDEIAEAWTTVAGYANRLRRSVPDAPV